jgi:hypothetical protein
MALNDRIPIYNLNFKKRIPLPDVIIIIPNFLGHAKTGKNFLAWKFIPFSKLTSKNLRIK